ncbi:MAG TPA: AI-2E family transporter, partial [Euzebyales bacterium]|nr:AI-2E family transporter [Euzebyales bacterium]
MNVRDARRPEDAVPFGVRVAAAWSWRLLLIAAAVGMTAYVAATLRLLVIPAVLAVLLTVLLEPVKQRLERAGLAPAAAALAALAALVVVLGGTFALLIPPVVDELDTLGRDLEAGARRVLEWASDGPLNASDDQVQAALDRLEDNLGTLASGVVAGAALVVELVVGLLLALVLTFFLLKDGHRLWRWVLRRVPPRRRPAAAELGSRIWTTLGAYLRGILIVALFDAVFIGLALVALGVPLALPLTVGTFIGAFIPIVGAFAAGAAATLVALVTGGLDQALLVLAAVVLVQQVESQILSPVVLGRAVKLHPAIVL